MQGREPAPSLGFPLPIESPSPLSSSLLPRPSRVPDRARPRFGIANGQPCPALRGDQKKIREILPACSRAPPPGISKLTLHVAAGDQALHGSPALNSTLICNHTGTGHDPHRVPAATTDDFSSLPARRPLHTHPSPASASLLVHPRHLRHVRKTFLGPGVT